MRRIAVLAAGVLAACVPPAGSAGHELMPLDQVRPGMIGVGRTVFEGSRIEDFTVKILGVLENAVGPNQSMIIARLEGGPLAQTGVISGMSGSPVFVDGKLVGAVAYGFPFSKETIAGITPIGDMVEATRGGAPRAASARFPSPLSASGPRLPLSREDLIGALRRPLPMVAAAAPDAMLPARGMPAAGMTPLSLPLVFSGFDPGAFEWARSVFAGLGFSPVLGTGGGARREGALPPLEPGSPVGVSLIEGDLDISVTGTVTHLDGDRVYAFGHPFYNLGPTQFPMRKAYVYSVFPSIYQSWKISSPAEPVGTMEQDRTTAIAGRLGEPPRMVPVEVKLTTSRGQQRRYSFRMVEDELLSPVLAYTGLLSVLQANERAYGTSTVRVEARLSLSDKREVRVEDVFAQEQPAAQASALVAAPLAYLMSNDFERVSFDKLEVDVRSFETVQSATLERAWVERSGPVRPGAVVPLKLLLRNYRGETLSESIPVNIPPSASSGTYTLLVADAAAINTLEQREMRQAFLPRDLDQLIRAINGLRRNHHLYVRLMRADDGAIVSGEYLQSLPSSVLSVLGASDLNSGTIPIRTSSVWDFDLPTEHAVTGSRTLSLTVER